MKWTENNCMQVAGVQSQKGCRCGVKWGAVYSHADAWMVGAVFWVLDTIYMEC